MKAIDFNSITVHGKSIKLVETTVYHRRGVRVRVDGYSIRIELRQDWQKDREGFCIFIYKSRKLVASSLHNYNEKYLTQSDVEKYIASKIG